MKFLSYSSKETKKIAKDLAEKLLKQPLEKSALIIALNGDLGSGKTTFVQGFLKAAGVKKRITSPTFVLMKRFEIKNKIFKNIYHIDCYRLEKPEMILKLDFKEITGNPENIILIEWPEKIEKVLPKKIKKINFEHGKKHNERGIIIF